VSDDLELMARIARGGKITPDDTKGKGSTESEATSKLTEGATMSLSYELGSKDKE
jgi:hypothetical protein